MTAPEPQLTEIPESYAGVADPRLSIPDIRDSYESRYLSVGRYHSQKAPIVLHGCISRWGSLKDRRYGREVKHIGNAKRL